MIHIIDKLIAELSEYKKKPNPHAFVIKGRVELIESLQAVLHKYESNTTQLLEVIGEEIDKITLADPENDGFIIHVNNKAGAKNRALITINKF